MGGSRQQRRRTGDTTVAGATQEREEGCDELFTPVLAALLRDNPAATVEQVLESLGAEHFQAPGGPDGQHTSVVEREGDAPEDGRRIALLIGNEHYAANCDLDTVPSETAELAGELGARGFSTRVDADRTATQLGSDYGGLVASAQEGDELVAYFAGHGANEGLCGIDDGVEGQQHLLENSTLQGMLGQARSRGANLRLILDCCHTGNLTNLVRNEFVDEEVQSGGASELTTLAQGYRELILNTLLERERVLQAFEDTLRGLPEEGSEPLRQGLRDTREATTRHYEQVLDEVWAEAQAALLPLLGGAAIGDPPQIRHHPTMGGPLQWLERAIDAGRSHAAA